MSFQQVVQDNNVPGPRKKNNMDQRAAYKSNGVAGSTMSGVQINHRGSSDTNYYKNGGVIFSQSQDESMSKEWNQQSNGGPNSTKNVVFRQKKNSKESVDSSDLETRIVPPTDINFRTLNNNNNGKHAN